MVSIQKEVDAIILEIQVETYFQGHVLGSFVLAEDGQGYEAVCQRCGMSVWVGNSGIFYSIMEDVCPGAPDGEEK